MYIHFTANRRKYSKSSFNIVDRFLELQQNIAERNQFYRRLTDINKSLDPVACIDVTKK